jgi:hypothetical protein
MALINCPECGKDVSDSAKSCPHCGYELKPQKDPEVQKLAQERIRKWKKKRKPIFLIIAVVLFIIAFAVPKEYILLIGLLMVISSIISMLKKEKWVGGSIATLILGALLILASMDYDTYLDSVDSNDPTSTENEINTNWKHYIQFLSTNDRWGGEGYKYHYIIAQIHNFSDVTIKLLKIEGNWYDKDGNILDTSFIYENDIPPGAKRGIEIPVLYSPLNAKYTVQVTDMRF